MLFAYVSRRPQDLFGALEDAFQQGGEALIEQGGSNDGFGYNDYNSYNNNNEYGVTDNYGSILDTFIY